MGRSQITEERPVTGMTAEAGARNHGGFDMGRSRENEERRGLIEIWMTE